MREDMTANLSFPEDQRPTRGIEFFYTDLHSAMHALGDLDQAPFPTAREFRQFLTAQFPQGMDGLCCLDAGCGGTAINSRSLVAARAGRVLAVDLNQGSLEMVRRSLGDRANRALSLACGSLLDMPFPAATFDFVACSGVVHHTPDPGRALRELRRIVKPTGRLYISAYCFEDSLMLPVVRLWRAAARIIPFSLMHGVFKRSAVVNNFVLDHMYVPILWVYRRPDFSRLLEQSGFRIEDTFVSSLDRFSGRHIGPWSLTGDGLLRVFICRPFSSDADG
jgi:ubiquinone/menaquinone biosynthesis C-methylase UbiE